MQWVKHRYAEFTKFVLSLLQHKEPALQVQALQVLMRLVKEEGEIKNPNHPSFDNELFNYIMHHIIKNQQRSEELVDSLIDNFINKYDDIRFYTIKNLK
jgi:U3 small nucleolar RNA-associated protein 19